MPPDVSKVLVVRHTENASELWKLGLIADQKNDPAMPLPAFALSSTTLKTCIARHAWYEHDLGNSPNFSSLIEWYTSLKMALLKILTIFTCIISSSDAKFAFRNWNAEPFELVGINIWWYAPGVQGCYINGVFTDAFHNLDIRHVLRTWLQRRRQINCCAIIVLVGPSSCHPKKGASNSMLPGSIVYDPSKHLENSLHSPNYNISLLQLIQKNDSTR